MFTGIVRHVGRVLSVKTGRGGMHLAVDVGPLAAGLAEGDSLAVDGACLTVCAVAGERAEFDVVPTTLARTTLGELTVGSLVNLEPALAVGEALGGHIVQGHVDGLAEVVRVEAGPGGHVLRLRAGRSLTDQMVPKGSVALAGVSLTLAELADGRFSVALVPATLKATTLGRARMGARLNVELDVIGKYVRRYLEQLGGGGVTMRKLREEGFA